MKLKKYLTELSMKREDTVIKVRVKSGSAYIVNITLNQEPETRYFTFKARRHDIDDFERSWGTMTSSVYSQIEKIHGGTKWDKNIWKIVFEDEDSNVSQFDLKDKKMVFSLFASLQKITKNFLESYNPEVWYFSAKSSEKSRVRLYDTISKKLKTWYHIERENYKSEILYIFWRKS